jgi:hypothetical protein
VPSKQIRRRYQSLDGAQRGKLRLAPGPQGHAENGAYGVLWKITVAQIPRWLALSVVRRLPARLGVAPAADAD